MAINGTFHGSNAGRLGCNFRWKNIIKSRKLALNKLNPQVAARMVGPLSRWRRYDEARQALMRQQLQRIADASELSRDVGEIVSKSLKQEP